MKRILLCIPPDYGKYRFVREGRCMQRVGTWASTWPPITLALIGAMLRDEFDVRITDCSAAGIGPQQFYRQAMDYQPDAVVMATSTPTADNDARVSRELKRLCPAVSIIVYGIHASVRYEEFMARGTGTQVIVREEPEASVVEAVKGLLREEGLESVAGIVYRRGDVIVANPRRRPLDVTQLPLPAWDLLNTDYYRMPFNGKKWLLILTGRGCDHGCHWCVTPAIYPGGCRSVPAVTVVDHMVRTQAITGVSHFHMWAENFTNDRTHVEEICDRLVAAKRGITWMCNARVDGIDFSLASRMRRAGCILVGLGIEAGSDRVLNLIGKHTTIDMGATAVKALKAAGIQSIGHFVLGTPGETLADLEATARRARTVGVDFAQFYCATPWPGSRLFESCLKNGWLTSKRWRDFEQCNATISTPSLPAQMLHRARSHAYRSFYFRFRPWLAIAPHLLRRPLHAIWSLKEMITWGVVQTARKSLKSQ